MNEAWQTYPTLPMPFYQGARAEAMQVAGFLDLEQEARKRGLAQPQWTALVDVFRTYPELSNLLDLRRRKIIDDAALTVQLNRLGFSDDNAARLVALQHELLSAADLAMMRQQGFITQQQQYDQSELVGQSNEHAELMFEIAGLPPGVEHARDMWRRNIIDESTFRQIIREGHEKIKYTDYEVAMKPEILSAATYSRLRLKGWISETEAAAGGALHGYSEGDMNLMYLSEGRPAAPGQMWTAAARGIDGPDKVPMNEAQFLKGIRESDIRPEWGPMLWGIRHLYPSLFQLTRLVTSGQIDSTTAADWAHKARYAPEVVTALEKSWNTTAAPAKHPNVVKAQNQLWTALHKTYISHKSTEEQVIAGFRLINSDPAEDQTILELWNYERGLERSPLTKAQIKKAWKEAAINAETGSPWTVDEAIAALTELGMSPTDAQSYLNI